MYGYTADDAFFAGEIDELMPYEVPHYVQHSSEGGFGYWTSEGDAAVRLSSLTNRCRPFEWVEDPRLDGWVQLLNALEASPDPAPLAERGTVELWQIMLMVARKDRFSEGTRQAFATALTAIANEIRRRLLGDRRAGRSFDAYNLDRPYEGPTYDADVPSADAEPKSVVAFAYSYYGPEHHGGISGANALHAAVQRRWNETGALPGDLDVLRNSLGLAVRAQDGDKNRDAFPAEPFNAAVMARIRELSGEKLPNKWRPGKRRKCAVTLDDAQRDRAAGVLLGTAAGDALGAGYEFGPPLSEGTQVDMVGGGQFNWAPGEWTDDTSMTVVIAQVAATGAELRGEFAQDRVVVRWAKWAEGAMDVGIQTRQVLGTAHGLWKGGAERSREAAHRLHEQSGRSAGNGSLMRTAPVALAYLDDPDAMVQAARKISALTHFDPVAGDACALWCLAIGHAVLTGHLDARVGLNRLSPDAAAYWTERLAEAEAAPPSAFENNGWVVHALQGAWSAISRTRVPAPDHLRLGLEAAVRGGRDTDTVAAIAGGLLGAAYGASAVPEQWRAVLHGWPGLRAGDLVDLTTSIIGG